MCACVCRHACGEAAEQERTAQHALQMIQGELRAAQDNVMQVRRGGRGRVGRQGRWARQGRVGGQNGRARGQGRQVGRQAG